MKTLAGLAHLGAPLIGEGPGVRGSHVRTQHSRRAPELSVCAEGRKEGPRPRADWGLAPVSCPQALHRR